MVISRTELPKPEEVLPGRSEKIHVPEKHFVNGNRMAEPFPDDIKLAMFGMGCFWGAEKRFWNQRGVYSTQVGYSSGTTPNPTYKELCTGLTGHTEVVRIAYHPSLTSYKDLLEIFWTKHDPTQGMKQNIDVGTQYRSGIYFYDEEQRAEANVSKEVYQQKLEENGEGKITTEILPVTEFYYAEDYHQQYLAKNPEASCGED